MDELVGEMSALAAFLARSLKTNYTPPIPRGSQGAVAFLVQSPAQNILSPPKSKRLTGAGVVLARAPTLSER